MFRRPFAVLAVLLAVTTTACSTNAPAPLATSPTASATPSGSPGATPTPIATSSPDSSPSSAKRSSSQLRKALLAASDLSPGFAKEKGGPVADSGIRISGRGADCRRLATILDTAKPEGSTTQANVSFTRAADGAGADEALDAMGTSTAARAYLGDLADAVDRCTTLKISLKGAGSSPLTVHQLSFAEIAQRNVAIRISATSGALNGFEVIQVGAYAGDVLVGMTFSGLDPTEAEAATQTAVTKVRQRLGLS